MNNLDDGPNRTDTNPDTHQWQWECIACGSWARARVKSYVQQTARDHRQFAFMDGCKLGSSSRFVYD